jgi:hypothetical protein
MGQAITSINPTFRGENGASNEPKPVTPKSHRHSIAPEEPKNKMNVAYIIHAYKNPDQLKRLIDTLDSERSFFFVHIDKKVNIKPFEELLVNNNKVYWIPRENSDWGTINTVKAVLNGIYQAIHSNVKFDYYYFLSGQDYPIKSNNYIYNFLQENKEKDFIYYFSLPSKEWKGGGIQRFNRYYLIISKNKYIRRIINNLGFVLPRRKLPYNLKPYGGEFYFGLSRKSVDYILSFIETHVDYLPFFKYTQIPEEIFFQTILLNADNNIKQHIINKTLTFIDWSRTKSSGPATLAVEDFDKITKCNELFARKFDLNLDSAILDMIDNQLLK